jgi:hypothetical protein
MDNPLIDDLGEKTPLSGLLNHDSISIEISSPTSHTHHEPSPFALSFDNQPELAMFPRPNPDKLGLSFFH